jgi:Ser/Thr protein kinase RdoA (MazF antagonist)
MADVPEVPTARLLAEETLAEAPDWGYLVFEFVPGVSIGEVYEQVSFEEKLALARRLGGWVKRMHTVDVRDGTLLPHLSLDLMNGWFAGRWPEERQKWPVRLAAGVREYLQENAAFVQSDAGSFIHADLTQDHFLGALENSRWTTRAVIDFGDAMLSNLYYDLAALHLDLFDCDKRLLAAFLEAYGLLPDPDFARKAMATSLLHQFDVYAHLFAWKPELQQVHTLDELAKQLWEV